MKVLKFSEFSLSVTYDQGSTHRSDQAVSGSLLGILGSVPVNDGKLKKYFEQIKRNSHNCGTNNNNCSLIINLLIDPIADTGVLTK